MNLFYYESKFKIIFFFGGGGGGGGGRGRGARVSDELAKTNLPLQLLQSFGHNNALMYKLCP